MNPTTETIVSLLIAGFACAGFEMLLVHWVRKQVEKHEAQARKGHA